MAQGNQILIKPLNIDILEKGSYIVGFVEVVSRMRKVRHKAAVYRCPGNLFGEGNELYKIVLRKRRVIGYCMVSRHGKEMHLPLLGSLDPRYRVGKILSGIAVERMLEQNCDALCLTASWNSLLHHRAMGFIPLDQKKINGAEYDRIIASRKLDDISALGCIAMYLPTEELERKMAEIRTPLLDVNKMFHSDIDVGAAQLYNRKKKHNDNFKIIKSTNACGVETYTLVRSGRRRLKIGTIILNYFRMQKDENGRSRYSNFFGEYPRWSVFYRYGPDEYGVNKTFAEFSSILNTREYDYDAVLRTLFQIALEAGQYHDCPRLQIEADWDEHLSFYAYGFRTQDFDQPKTAAEINDILDKENFLNRENSRILRRRGPSNLNKLGSVDMILTRERALEKGWQEFNALNRRPPFYKRWWFKLRNCCWG